MKDFVCNRHPLAKGDWCIEIIGLNSIPWQRCRTSRERLCSAVSLWSGIWNVLAQELEMHMMIRNSKCNSSENALDGHFRLKCCWTLCKHFNKASTNIVLPVALVPVPDWTNWYQTFSVQWTLHIRWGWNFKWVSPAKVVYQTKLSVSNRCCYASGEKPTLSGSRTSRYIGHFEKLQPITKRKNERLGHINK